jgi:CubicO group peptidase (beta-lactamase class C family)
MVERGEVRLSDTLGSLFPSRVKLPNRTASITLKQLAAHQSGLPRIPHVIAKKDDKDPYVGFTPTDLIEYLGAYRLRYKPGEHYRYSNLGYGILGHILAYRLEMPFDQAVMQRVCLPLGMTDTMVHIPLSKQNRLAQGHDALGEPTNRWLMTPVFLGAAALHSSAADLLKFVSANLGLVETRLAGPLAYTRRFARKIPDGPRCFMCLGWYKVLGRLPKDAACPGERRVYLHHGDNNAFHCFMGFDEKSKIGLVALSNAHHKMRIASSGEEVLKKLLAGKQ